MDQKSMFSEHSYKIIKQAKTKNNFQKEIKQLPYIFSDPVQFDKKIDPKKLQFGSKIDNNHSKREKFYRVKEIVSPNTIVLNNDLKIKLLGIKENPKTKNDAILFLTEKTQGQKVFMKFDRQKYDKNNNLLCYLYLQNKTFLNSHLLKQRIVNVDTSQDFKYKNKFLAMGNVNE